MLHVITIKWLSGANAGKKEDKILQLDEATENSAAPIAVGSNWTCADGHYEVTAYNQYIHVTTHAEKMKALRTQLHMESFGFTSWC